LHLDKGNRQELRGKFKIYAGEKATFDGKGAWH